MAGVSTSDPGPLIEKALRGGLLTSADLTCLLDLPAGPGRQRLFSAAREMRRRHFGDQVFLYGFLYTSTHCRNNCTFCLYRRDNHGCRRYRLEPAQVRRAAVRLADSGVHMIDLTMGEDPLLHAAGESAGFEPLAELTSDVRRETGLPVMVSPGVASESALERLAHAGADWYALYQETHEPGLFARLRPGQDFGERMAAKRAARRVGLLVEEGVLCGVGETPAALAESVRVMGEMGAAQVRAMTFVPHPGITKPLSVRRSHRFGRQMVDSGRELLTIAVLRLALPDRLIPASLDIDGLSGLESRLEAGANVVTSLVPPGEGLAGVVRSTLDIEDGRRTVAGVAEVLARCGLRPAGVLEYARWVGARRAEGAA